MSDWIKIDGVYYKRKDKYKWIEHDEYGVALECYKSNVFVVQAFLDGKVEKVPFGRIFKAKYNLVTKTNPNDNFGGDVKYYKRSDYDGRWKPLDKFGEEVIHAVTLNNDTVMNWIQDNIVRGLTDTHEFAYKYNLVKTQADTLGCGDIWYYRRNNNKWDAIDKFGEILTRCVVGDKRILEWLESKAVSIVPDNTVFTKKEVWPKVFVYDNVVFKFSQDYFHYQYYHMGTGLSGTDTMLQSVQHRFVEAINHNREKLLKLFE